MGFITKDKQATIKALEKELSLQSRYMGPPTFSYVVGEYTIDRNGYVDGPSKDILNMIQMGVAADPQEMDRADVEMETSDIVPDTVRNLISLIHSKQYLLERSLGYRAFHIPDELMNTVCDKSKSVADILIAIRNHKPTGITSEEGKVKLTGFPSGEAFELLADAMIDYCKKKRYIIPDETVAENEKYYMRAWLVRLGLGGSEHKTLRRMMLKNLNGHVAFRTSQEAEDWKKKHSKHNRQNA